MSLKKTRKLRHVARVWREDGVYLVEYKPGWTGSWRDGVDAAQTPAKLLRLALAAEYGKADYRAPFAELEHVLHFHRRPLVKTLRGQPTPRGTLVAVGRAVLDISTAKFA